MKQNNSTKVTGLFMEVNDIYLYFIYNSLLFIMVKSFLFITFIFIFTSDLFITLLSLPLTLLMLQIKLGIFCHHHSHPIILKSSSRHLMKVLKLQRHQLILLIIGPAHVSIYSLICLYRIR